MNVIYTDLIYSNISLNNSLYIKFLNFNNSLLNSSKPSVMVTASYKYPKTDLKLT